MVANKHDHITGIVAGLSVLRIHRFQFQAYGSSILRIVAAWRNGSAHTKILCSQKLLSGRLSNTVGHIPRHTISACLHFHRNEVITISSSWWLTVSALSIMKLLCSAGLGVICVHVPSLISNRRSITSLKKLQYLPLLLSMEIRILIHTQTTPADVPKQEELLYLTLSVLLVGLQNCLAEFHSCII